MFPNNVHAHVVDIGEWALYKASVVPDNGDFDIHNWWYSRRDRLPTMYPYLLGSLIICQCGAFWHFLGHLLQELSEYAPHTPTYETLNGHK